MTHSLIAKNRRILRCAGSHVLTKFRETGAAFNQTSLGRPRNRQQTTVCKTFTTSKAQDKTTARQLIV